MPEAVEVHTLELTKYNLGDVEVAVYSVKLGVCDFRESVI